MREILTRAIDALEQAIAGAREQRSLSYAEALALFQRLDLLHEQMEVVLVETPDYPDNDEEDDS